MNAYNAISKIARALRIPKSILRMFSCRIVRLGPRFYDFYYRHISPFQQSSIKHRYPEPPWHKHANHVLVFTMRYWAIHTAIESAFAKERQRQGWNVTMVGCDAAISTCDNTIYYKGELPLTSRCDYCSYMLRRLCQRIGIHYLSICRYLQQHKLQNRVLSKERDYEKLTFVSWTRLLRSLHPKEPSEFALRDSLIASCRTIDNFLTHYLDNHRVDQVIMLNGKFFTEQLLAEHCREKKIPFITYERGIIRETVMLADGKPAIPAVTQQRWKQRRENSLTQVQRKKLYAYIESRKFVGNAETVPFYTNMIENQKQLCEKHNIDSQKNIVVLFTNSIWDSAVVAEDTIFENIFNWITISIEHYRYQRDTQLVIRVHPVEVRIAKQQQTRDRVDDYVRRNFTNLSNVRIIPPESSASPYTLAEMAKLGLVYNSTIGLEMALRGKPVIVASNAHYAGTEFVYTPKNRDEYLRLLDQPLPALPNQVMYTERYSYMFFFEHMVPYGDIIRQCGTDYQFVRDLRKSTILEKAGF